jgi:S-adenosylmethionine-dependent methyltransferase
MTQPQTPAFDRLHRQFDAYYETVRGHVREKVTRINLLEHLEGDSLRVLDVGGGLGRDAVWLAQMGHDVTLVEPAGRMVAMARQRVADAGADVSAGSSTAG